jgi:phenylpropionate dioxygenase-like ring-hydroxylating dioxygenase large terminal subunit
MSENFTLYRGEGGTAHVVAFQCAHRGLQLSVGWVEDDCIRCRYHGWKYDATGQCIEYEDENPEIRAQYERECARNSVPVNMRPVEAD